NWPRVTVEALASRLEVLSLIMPGKETADESLMEGWLANDLDSESHKTHTDAFIYGRSFVAVGTNEEDRDRPLITVEDPRQITVRVDPRKRRVEAALRIYGREET